MMQTLFLTLYFDARSEQMLRERFADLAGADVDVPSLHGHRPLITLAAYDTDTLDAYHSCVSAFAATQAPFPLRLHALGIFPEARVVFFAPRVTRTLLTLHATLLQTIDATINTPLKYAHNLGVDSWAPHCTIAIGADETALEAVLPRVMARWEPLVVTVEGIGMLVPPAVTDCAQYAFGQHSDAAV